MSKASKLEFTEDWQVFALGDLLKFSNGINADKSAYGSGIPFANVLEVITHQSLTPADIPGRITVTPKLLARYEVQRNDMLFNRTSETQDEVGLASVYLGNEPIVFGGFVFRGQPLSDELDPSYAKYALRSHAVRSQIMARGQGGIRANIGQRDLKSVTVTLPLLVEQGAISNALDDVSELISQMERLIAKKQAIKQGLMQQLLTGRKRLPGFADEWRQSTVGEEFDAQLGKRLDAAVSRGVLKTCINNRAVRWGRVLLNEAVEAPLTDADIPVLRLVSGDVLMCEGGEVGRSAVWRGELQEAYFLNTLHRLRSKGDFNPYLLVAFFERWARTQELSAVVGKATLAHLTKENLLRVPVPVPGRDEQERIAAILIDADDELDALGSRLTKARDIKAGMMQQLLTGRTRLPVAEVAS
ncbi:restriction endonuclease subunit S [Mycolicibacterium hodleri]|uniref:Restriction endonuclease subunit S n=1 Tax=Mycolicibacterium hodleri TaxID=49897 RepID=A0A502DNP5_9MYCO|nr:restriction endonuclease subunit S [Mycolicibacterium hodleri]TPG26129.1 restriction endonuclease subunit S [Mycolicibacterium hodleri]